MPEPTRLFTGAPLYRRDAQNLAVTLKALADPTRLQILAVLAAAPRERLTGVEVQAALAAEANLTLSQPTVAHHLNILDGACLIDRVAVAGVTTVNTLSRPRLAFLAELLLSGDRR